MKFFSKGHTNWVKNIEYSHRESLLVTSGFDGQILTWDINDFSRDDAHARVFGTKGLMRMRLGPGAEKMVISTMNGFLIVVHDLELKRMEEDFKDFNVRPTTFMPHRRMTTNTSPF